MQSKGKHRAESFASTLWQPGVLRCQKLCRRLFWFFTIASCHSTLNYASSQHSLDMAGRQEVNGLARRSWLIEMAGDVILTTEWLFLDT